MNPEKDEPWRSPVGTSRYGRSRRPKITEDFYNIDNVVVDLTKPKSRKSPTKSKSNFEFGVKDEYNQFEDLGTRIANKFKAKIHRGLLDSAKERKFFKTTTTADTTEPVTDVTKVLKLVAATPTAEIAEIFAKKPAPIKSAVKTYANKRKSYGLEDACVESFGLPDEPIVSVKAAPPVNKKIDVSLSEKADINLIEPWRCDYDENRVAPVQKVKEVKAEICENAAEIGDQSILPKSEIEFGIGDLVWAKIGNYPYWPCMVTDEPDSGCHYKFVKRWYKPMYHVRFFGDNGRRSWVSGNAVLPYKSSNDLEEYAAEYANEKKIAQSFRVKKLKPIWNVAVAEAEAQKAKGLYDRLDYFNQVLQSSPKKIEPIFDDTVKEDPDADIKPKIHTSPKKLPTKVKNARPEPNPGRKRLRSSIVINPISYEVKEELIDEDKLHSEIVQLSKKRKISVSEESDRKIESTASDTDSKISDISVPTSLESQAALYRRNNIFRGVPRGKFCDVCAKGGIDVTFCRGICGGYYHPACVQPKKPIKNVLPKLEPIEKHSPLTLAEKIDLKMREIMEKSTKDEYCELSDSSSDAEIVAIATTKKLQRPKKAIVHHVTADGAYACAETPPLSISPPTPPEKSFKCTPCQLDQRPLCHICNATTSKNGDSSRHCCYSNRCDKFYHSDCLKKWPHTKPTYSETSADAFMCPRHVCHTCAVDDPRANNTVCPGNKSVKCLRCPATYHASSHCVPAGCVILTSTQILCPRHFYDSASNVVQMAKKRAQTTVNTNWCFVCSEGGKLICCETCPVSVHAECMDEKLNDDEQYYCDNCQWGRFPLYDEIVWVKLGNFRWWPALILFPNDVPEKVKCIRHNSGDFVVRFYGTYDHYWIGRGRTFVFQEGDQGQTGGSKRKVNTSFIKAIEEAAQAHDFKRRFKVAVINKNTAARPPHYISIKSNKPVGGVRQFDGNASNATACDCDPNDAHPCGPESNCLNRLLLTECDPEVCPAGERCNNRRFEKREYPPLKPYRTLERGWGLKTLAPIGQGQFIIEYVGEMIDEPEYRRRIKQMHEKNNDNYYFLTIDNYRMLDAGPKGNVARFMNHSCQPNCETQKWTVGGGTRVGLFANCDIAADTELTFNYNLECVGEEKKICRCLAPNCSGFIGVKVKTDEIKKAKKSSTKSKYKKRKAMEEVIVQNPCFICGKFGNVGACNNKICTKFYHLKCVSLEEWPEGGKWICPWHSCNFCAKRTIRCCTKCINSYCPPHSVGMVRYDTTLLAFVCYVHDPKNSLTSPKKEEPEPEDSIVLSDDDEKIPILSEINEPKSEILDEEPLVSDKKSNEQGEIKPDIESGLDKKRGRPKKATDVEDGKQSEPQCYVALSDTIVIKKLKTKLFSKTQGETPILVKELVITTKKQIQPGSQTKIVFEKTEKLPVQSEQTKISDTVRMKRGRPKKVEVPDEHLNKPKENEQNSVILSDTEDQKIVNKSGEIAIDSTIKDESEKDSFSDDEKLINLVPSKAKRGRPRKIIPTNVEATDIESSSNNDEETPIRKRGRPRKTIDASIVVKTPVSSNETQVITPTHSDHTYIAMSAEKSNNNTSLASENKKVYEFVPIRAKRGRPRKIRDPEEINKEKRKRGRPRKDSLPQVIVHEEPIKHRFTRQSLSKTF